MIEKEEADFWAYILMENVSFLLKKQEEQGIHNPMINIDELVQEAINHVTKTTNRKIESETESWIYRFLQENSIGINLWEIKKGYVVSIDYIANIFLKKAQELFSEEKRRYRSVLNVSELVEEVANDLRTGGSEELSDERKRDLYNIMEKLCTEDKLFKKIREEYIIFDENGRKRLKELSI